MSFEVERVRNDFPILSRKFNGKNLVYLDNAATTQKPRKVIDAISNYYLNLNSNVHRGAYFLSQEATDGYELARQTVAKWIGAQTSDIIFTRGTTEAANLVAHSWGRNSVKAGDDIVVTRMEHHSNFVPWQELAREVGANFKIVEVDSEFRLDIASLKKSLEGKPKVLAVSMASNVLGALNPIKEVAELAKQKGARIFVDAAQALPNRKVDIRELGPIDFLAFSGHKMCGPTGIGALWGRNEVLQSLSPYQSGGSMIQKVEDQRTLWAEVPMRFEAGTPNIAGTFGFKACIDYLDSIGIDRIEAYERELLEYALDRFSDLKDIRLIGPTELESRLPVFSFVVNQIHPHDLATFLDVRGIAVRAGHHCAQPLISKLGISATLRASFYFYNLKSEVDQLVEGLVAARKYFG